ncbi:MAG: hypothetical protein LBD70_01350, partial [Bifidobacteriaceae bacterium]|nr:hypothetical protein [Bifidobacteriaceae bacterium]
AIDPARPADSATDSATEQFVAPTLIAPSDGGAPPTAPLDPRSHIWAEPARPPWREPQRVDYRTWLDGAGAGAAPAARPLADVDFPAHDAVYPPSPYPSPPRPVRWLAFGLWALLGALALYWPWAVVGVAAFWLVVARTVWVGVEAVAARRHRRGRRPADRTRTVLALPWYCLRGLGGAIPALALGGLVGGAGYFVVANVLETPPAGPAAAAASVAAGLAVAWWGPSAAETRQGMRAILRGLLAPPWARWLVTALSLASAAALLIGRLA